jgi:SAM-dependent methyltransferase
VAEARTHWQQIYRLHEPEALSWHEPVPEISLSLIEEAGLPEHAAVLDVGGGASKLAGRLVTSHYCDVTVVDIASRAIEQARAELGPAADRVKWIEADIRWHDFGRQFDLWHDRAVFHFMVAAEDRDGYLDTLRRTLLPGGHLILAIFGPAGPTQCSGLPVVRYGAAELSQVLGRDFELVSSRLEQHRTPGGHIQQLLYAHFRRQRDGGSQSTKQ